MMKCILFVEVKGESCKLQMAPDCAANRKRVRKIIRKEERKTPGVLLAWVWR